MRLHQTRVIEFHSQFIETALTSLLDIRRKF